MYLGIRSAYNDSIEEVKKIELIAEDIRNPIGETDGRKKGEKIMDDGITKYVREKNLDWWKEYYEEQREMNRLYQQYMVDSIQDQIEARRKLIDRVVNHR